ncbi:MAG: hypothetical protein IJA94_03120 [Bacilli bacterium]|nr:hypothetical protein [Bacilli bacterium]
MLLTNPMYSGIDLYLTDLEKHFESGCRFEYDYRSYDKNKDDVISYICFEIKSLLKSPQNIIIKSIKYDGQLKFEYHKAINEIYISELPFIDDGKNKFYIFTHDIALILSKAVANIVDLKSVKIKFINDFFLSAIDRKTLEVLPTVSNTYNWNMLVSIHEGIKKEIEKIKVESIRYKEQQERKYKAEERALIKRRKVQGLDPEAFENYDLFEQALTEHILAKNTKRKANLQPKLESCIRKYKELLKSCDLDLINSNSPYYFNNNSKGHTEDYEKLDINEKLVIWYDFDLNHDKGLLNVILNIKYDLYNNRSNSENGIIHKDSYVMRDELNAINYTHPALSKNDVKELEVFISLLYNIKNLYNKIYHVCPAIDKAPLDHIYSFSKHSSAIPWSKILKFPFWLSIYYDSYPNIIKETFGLFMIKPGVNKIDYSKIMCFSTDKAKYVHFTDEFVNRRIITIPRTLPYDEICKLVNFSIENSYHLNFICEDITNYIIIKRILILKELDSFYSLDKKQKDGVGKKIKWFVNLDPNYYNDYMVTIANNKTYWHKFDFTSDYKYRRKDPLDIKAIVEECVNRYCKSKTEFNLKRSLIEKILLGDIIEADKELVERKPEQFKNIYEGFKLEKNFRETLRNFYGLGNQGFIGLEKYRLHEILTEYIVDNNHNQLYLGTTNIFKNYSLLEAGLFAKELSSEWDWNPADFEISNFDNTEFEIEVNYSEQKKEDNTENIFPEQDNSFKYREKLNNNHLLSFKCILEFLKRICINKLLDEKIFIDSLNQNNAFIVSKCSYGLYSIELIKADNHSLIQEDHYFRIYFKLTPWQNTYRICLIAATRYPDLDKETLFESTLKINANTVVFPKKLSDDILNRIFEKFDNCIKANKIESPKLTKKKPVNEIKINPIDDLPF